IAAHPRALARHGDLEEGLAEVVGAARVGDESVRGPVPRVHVGVDEAGADKLAARVDLLVHRPREGSAHVDDAIVLPHDHAVADERVALAREADDPAAADEPAHSLRLPLPRTGRGPGCGSLGSPKPSHQVPSSPPPLGGEGSGAHPRGTKARAWATSGRWPAEAAATVRRRV